MIKIKCLATGQIIEGEIHRQTEEFWDLFVLCNDGKTLMAFPCVFFTAEWEQMYD